MISDAIVCKKPEIAREDAEKMAKEVLDILDIKKETDKNGKIVTKALFFISKKQADNIADVMLDKTIGPSKIRLEEALKKNKGIELSLFGRMVADDPSLNVDASSQVAHSISTHRVENECDFFTAIDDLQVESEQGAEMMNVVEYNSSTLYRYSTVAVHDLYKNLDDINATSKAVGEFVRAFIVSMPNGKQNTFANRTPPYAVLITARKDQPVNLVGAFESPIRTNMNCGGYIVISVASNLPRPH